MISDSVLVAGLYGGFFVVVTNQRILFRRQRKMEMYLTLRKAKELKTSNERIRRILFGDKDFDKET
jgi:hypothetical protein